MEQEEEESELNRVDSNNLNNKRNKILKMQRKGKRRRRRKLDNNNKEITVIQCNYSRNESNLAESSGQTSMKEPNGRSRPFTWLLLARCLLLGLLSLPLTSGQSLQSLRGQAPGEYLLSGQINEQVQLPCLIGRQLYCGEPYFIAWYKLNAANKQWTRIEHKSPDDLNEIIINSGEQQPVAISHSSNNNEQPTGSNERFRFSLTRRSAAGSSNNSSSRLGACDQQTVSQQQQQQAAVSRSNSSPVAGLRQPPEVDHSLHNSNSITGSSSAAFDCAQLTIRRLDLGDEGQYKCEITFSESLDFDKCPATTMSQLNVIARPQEPELLVNGKRMQPQREQVAAFKEGAQVKLECLSAGGRPAPRIEWLNVSGWQPPEAEVGAPLTLGPPPESVQLMRAHWPTQQRRLIAGHSPPQVDSGQNPSLPVANSSRPLTSSSVTISLSRYDLSSHFVCLVLPVAPPGSAAGGQLSQPSDQLLKSPAYLSALLHQKALTNQQHPLSPMLKWLKLDVQVKPSGMVVAVRDLQTGGQLSPVTQPASGDWRLSQQRGFPVGSSGEQLQPFYSLQPNKLYAVQCIVEGSRPKSHISWFNRTAPVELEPKLLLDSDFLLPPDTYLQDNNRRPLAESPHRISSFLRHTQSSNGTFRTSATLLITTSIWDNLEELFCRASNEAFQFDELLQVAPIMSIRLYVNYPPLAWMDVAQEPAKQLEPASSGHQQNKPLTRDAGVELTIRCHVAANPLLQNTILQIEWLKDNRKLAPPSATQQQRFTAVGQAPASRMQIEKENHLHMPMSSIGPHTHQSAMMSPELMSSAAATNGHLLNSSQLKSSSSGSGPLINLAFAGGAKLIGSSSLTIRSLLKSDSGSYSCHYRLIPAPISSSPEQQSPASQLPAPMQIAQLSGGGGGGPIRITSGQANQSIQLNVLEARVRNPTLRIMSSAPLLLYGPRQSPPGGRRASQSQPPVNLMTLVADQPLDGSLQLSLRCELRPFPASDHSSGTHHKVMWHLNGALLHSSGGSGANQLEEIYNITLGQLFSLAGETQTGASLSCAHQFLGPTSGSDVSSGGFHANQVRVLQSVNRIDLRLRVKPKLLNKREFIPPVRSFSEPELSANPSGKLKLLCMAQCEPLCSIDWLINERRLTDRKSQQQQWHLNNVTTEPVSIRSSGSIDLGADFLFEEKADGLGEGAGSRGYHHPAQRLLSQLQLSTRWSRRNESSAGQPFAWLKESSLSLAAQTAADSTHHIKTPDYWPAVSGGPAKWAVGEQQAANVFSELELGYQQIGALLAGGDRRLLVKCRLSTALDGAISGNAAGHYHPFGHLILGPDRWFPAAAASLLAEENSRDSYQYPDGDDDELQSLSGGPLDLLSTARDNATGRRELHPVANWQSPTANGQPLDLHSQRMLLIGRQQQPEVDKLNEQENEALTDDLGKSKPMTNKQHAAQLQQVDELQISILMDKPPRRVSVSFGGITSSEQEVGGISISESQLLAELMDPNKAAPLLQCKSSGYPYPKPKFRWTFADLNETEHSLASDGPKLNLRQFIEFRQRQLQVSPMSAYGAEVVASIVGNYTCIAGNIHGSARATMPLQIQGRPLCKLTLGSEYLSPENELMAKLRCLVYSMPLLQETIWFRGSQQVAKSPSNKSLTTETSSNNQVAAAIEPKDLVSVVELSVMVLNKQQDFMLIDLVNQAANFKCIARNQLGYSEACELGPMDRQSLLNAFKPLSTRSPAQSMISLFTSGTDQQPAIVTGNSSIDSLISPFLATSTNTQSHHHEQAPQPPASGPLVRAFLARLDWMLILVCASALVYLLYLMGSSFVRRRYPDPRDKLAGPTATSGNTTWRFNASRAQGGSHEPVGSPQFPFESKTICVNYYGGSNGDSERDMMQSCSQSSHYEDYGQQQLHHLSQQQQPIYFNGPAAAATLQRRTLMKPSVSTSSTGDSSTTGGGSRPLPVGPQQQQLTTMMNGGSGTMNQPIKLAATMRESLMAGGQNGGSGGSRYTSAGSSSSGAALSLTSNVPLINGSHNSQRINLDNQPQCRFQGGGHQQTFGVHHQTVSHNNRNNNDHIYDDVIYNQMIL